MIGQSSFKNSRSEDATPNGGLNAKYKDLYEFGKAMQSEVKTIGYGNVLLEDGFCDVELELINAFLEADPRIQWGGTITRKIDGMHFGFTTLSVKNIIK